MTRMILIVILVSVSAIADQSYFPVENWRCVETGVENGSVYIMDVQEGREYGYFETNSIYDGCFFEDKGTDRIWKCIINKKYGTNDVEFVIDKGGTGTLWDYSNSSPYEAGKVILKTKCIRTDKST